MNLVTKAIHFKFLFLSEIFLFNRPTMKLALRVNPLTIYQLLPKTLGDQKQTQDNISNKAKFNYQ